MKNRISKFFIEHWWKIIAGGMLAGFLTELLNTYVWKWWVYHNPLNVFYFSEFPLGTPLVFGWLAISFLALLITISFENIRPRTRAQLYWILAWIAMGFAIEFFNSNIWQTWHYTEGTLWDKLIVPALNFGIFIPIVGWGATGVITFWFHKYFIASFGKGPYRCSVCWMKVDKRITLKYKSKKIYFCSENCKLLFKNDPKKYETR